jgi:hypothetical protein
MILVCPGICGTTVYGALALDEYLKRFIMLGMFTTKKAANGKKHQFNFQHIVFLDDSYFFVLWAKEKKIVAYYEVGHALVAALTPGYDAVHKISIIPRGLAALGYTQQRPTENRYLMSHHELLAKIDALLDGRMAEKLTFGGVTHRRP